jgi:hypothetical protein
MCEKLRTLCVLLVPLQTQLSFHSRRGNVVDNCSFSFECLIIPHNFRELLKSKLRHGSHFAPWGVLMRTLLIVVRVELPSSTAGII